MRIVQTIILCLFLNVCYAQKGDHEKNTIAISVHVDSLGNIVSARYIQDSSNVKGLSQVTLDKMIEISQKKIKSMYFPASNSDYKQLFRFDYAIVGSKITKE